MQLSKTIEDITTKLHPVRRQGASLGFVPTMGALHHGHMRLVEQAQRKCDKVVVSIFVNPKQFGEGEDFDTYPRTLDADIALLQKAGVDYCFAPPTQEMWPQGNETIVETVNLAHILMGALRPGHFCGVTTIVAKLFNIMQPSHAFFGEKDFQQLAIIRRMVKDLNFPIEIIGVAIARDEDGVAQSSRNALLTGEERRAAVVIPRAIEAATSLYAKGERSVSQLIEQTRAILASEPLGVIEAVDMRDCETLQPVNERLNTPSVLLLTVRFGKIRLIDQHVFMEESKK